MNDEHGHLVGDRVLAATANAISSAVRGADTAARVNQTAARVGGEEFGILLPTTDLEGALAVAERIRAEVGDIRIPLREGGEVRITASLGVATITGEIPGGEKAWFAASDDALYSAKHAGRNRVVAVRVGTESGNSLRTVG